MNKVGYSKVNNLQNAILNLNESTIYNCKFKNELINNIKSITFDDCEFHNCKIEGVIDYCTFTNCLFINCDLSNCTIKECGIHYITIEGSKMLGLSFIDSLIKNTNLKDNLSNFIGFSNMSFNNVEFINNKMENASFIQTKFKNVNFIDNKMKDAEFIDTSLYNVDLSTNDISNIKISLENIKGTIINSLQVYDLINLLNIKIK